MVVISLITYSMDYRTISGENSNHHRYSFLVDLLIQSAFKLLRVSRILFKKEIKCANMRYQLLQPIQTCRHVHSAEIQSKNV